MRRLYLLLQSVAAGAVLVGCADQPGQASFVVDTVAGIVTVTNVGTGSWGLEAGWTVSGPLTRIGSVEGDGPGVFGQIGAVAVGHDRSIFVADAQAHEVRVFSADGQFVTDFGGSGEGPGEFSAIDGLVVEPAGTVAVRDPRLARVSRFQPDGTFVTSFRLARPYLIFSDGTTFWGDREGRLYDRMSLSFKVGTLNVSRSSATHPGATCSIRFVCSTMSPPAYGRRVGASQSCPSTHRLRRDL